MTLGLEEPDRVLIGLWSSSGLDRSLGLDVPAAREEFLDRHGVDLRHIDDPRYVGPPIRRWPDGTEEDIWGVVRRIQSVTVAYGREDYKEVYKSALSCARTSEQVHAYPHWPYPDWFDYDDIANQCEAVRRKGRVVLFMRTVLAAWLN